MKLGLSSYCMTAAITAGEMTVLDFIRFAAQLGAEHVELVPFGYTLLDNDELLRGVVDTAKECGVPINSYAVLSNLILENEDELTAEIERVKRHVDVAAAMGCHAMRHDVSSFRRPFETNTILHFERELPIMVRACREITEYAAKKNVITTLENHGFHVNGSDRTLRLIDQVNHPNYGHTLDVGNFLCVDEPAEIGTLRTIHRATNIHMKDFFVRHRDPGGTTLFDCLGSWFRSVNGSYLRGTIVGQGDIDMPRVINTIKDSGFDGAITIEFEGMEDPRVGCAVGLSNVRRLWES